MELLWVLDWVGDRCCGNVIVQGTGTMGNCSWSWRDDLFGLLAWVYSKQDLGLFRLVYFVSFGWTWK